MAQAAEQLKTPPISQGNAPRVFNKEQTKELLGGISNATYYRIRSRRLLLFSRLFPGGPVVHTPQQIADYISYLDREGVVNRPPENSAPQRPNAVTRLKPLPSLATSRGRSS
jgi:hypothetical protein